MRLKAKRKEKKRDQTEGSGSQTTKKPEGVGVGAAPSGAATKSSEPTDCEQKTSASSLPVVKPLIRLTRIDPLHK